MLGRLRYGRCVVRSHLRHSVSIHYIAQSVMALRNTSSYQERKSGFMRRFITLLLARSTCFIFLFLLFIQTGLAQSGGQVSGRITDRTAGALASAKVTLKNLATQSELAATTDSGGH